jgi:two-component system alkaline phosphatase synthesis response regulator PhoP
MSTVPAKILLADDDPDILEFMEYNLRKEGYDVRLASNGKEAVEAALKEIPHLILLDIMMPEMDGIEACKKMRSYRKLDNTVIAFLTARNEDYSQLSGFESGADDYITKPIKPKILISRIRALLRRVHDPEADRRIVLGDIEIDPEQYAVFKKGIRMELPKKEFELLLLLASKPGKVFSRNSILDRIWGNDIVVGDRTIDVHIRKLREKIGEENIKTVKGVGYKFDL